ncbi:MAG: aminoacyl-tRNA hydrolase [Vampirovibrionales bacterium]|nr:aminoacyl-tRNA hydrolase [Vampirovibrionales bacterium]
MAAPQWIIVGLGNPGSKYANTRHNIGFMALDYLIDALAAQSAKLPAGVKATAWQARINQASTLLLQPATFMNLSGEALQPLLAFYKLSIEQVIVIYDDVALPFGRLRVRQGGGSGGHNGIKSIIQHAGEKFIRVRVGIMPSCLIPNEAPTSEPPIKSSAKISGDLADFVLSPFSGGEQKQLPHILKAVHQGVHVIISQGTPAAMNAVNGVACG